MGCGVAKSVEKAVSKGFKDFSRGIKATGKSVENIARGRASSKDWLNVGTASAGAGFGSSVGVMTAGNPQAGAALSAGGAVDMMNIEAPAPIDATSDLKVEDSKARLRKNLFMTIGEQAGQDVTRVGGRSAVFRK